MKKKQHFEDEYFEDIDSVAAANNYFLPVLEEVSSIVKLREAKVLDVGCGTGVFMAPIVTKGCNNLYGVDGPNSFVTKALERGYKDVLEIEDLNYSSLPFVSESFDLVVCKDVFEHLLDPEFSLKEINRVLKLGGTLLLHVPNHFPIAQRIKFMFNNNIDTFNFFPGSSRWSFPHIRFYEYTNFKAVLLDNGFEATRELSHHFASVPFIGRFKFLDSFRRYLASKSPNNFAAGFTILVTKTRNSKASEKIPSVAKHTNALGNKKKNEDD